MQTHRRSLGSHSQNTVPSNENYDKDLAAEVARLRRENDEAAGREKLLRAKNLKIEEDLFAVRTELMCKVAEEESRRKKKQRAQQGSAPSSSASAFADDSAARMEELKTQVLFLERELAASKRVAAARDTKSRGAAAALRKSIARGKRNPSSSSSFTAARSVKMEAATNSREKTSSACQTVRENEKTSTGSSSSLSPLVLSFVEECFDDVLLLIRRGNPRDGSGIRVDSPLVSAIASRESPFSLNASATLDHGVFSQRSFDSSSHHLNGGGDRRRIIPSTPMVVADSAGPVKKLLSFRTPLMRGPLDSPGQKSKPPSQVSPFALAGRAAVSAPDTKMVSMSSSEARIGAEMKKMTGDLYRCLLRLISGSGEVRFTILLPVLEMILDVSRRSGSGCMDNSDIIASTVRIYARVAERCSESRSLLLGRQLSFDAPATVASPSLQGNNRVVVKVNGKPMSPERGSTSDAAVSSVTPAHRPSARYAAVDTCTSLLSESASLGRKGDLPVALAIIDFFSILAWHGMFQGLTVSDARAPRLSLRKLERLFTRGVLGKIFKNFGKEPSDDVTRLRKAAVELMVFLLQDASGALPERWVTDEAVTGMIPRPWNSFHSDESSGGREDPIRNTFDETSPTPLSARSSFPNEAPPSFLDASLISFGGGAANRDSCIEELNLAILRMCSSIISQFREPGIAWLLHKSPHSCDSECDPEDGNHSTQSSSLDDDHANANAPLPDPSILLWLINIMYEEEALRCGQHTSALLREAFSLFAAIWPFAVSKNVWQAVAERVRSGAKHMLSYVILALRGSSDAAVSSQAMEIFSTIE